MSEPGTSKKVPNILLSGPVPDQPEMWCATCAMIYMGTISGNETVQKDVTSKHEKAMEQNQSVVTFSLERLLELITPSPGLVLHHAVTVAPSTHFDAPMPVCWTHIKGWRQTANHPIPSGLIAGKKHTIPRPAGSG